MDPVRVEALRAATDIMVKAGMADGKSLLELAAEIEAYLRGSKPADERPMNAVALAKAMDVLNAA